MMRRDSLAARLVLAASLWLALALGLGGLVLAEAFRASAERGFERRLESLLQALVAGTEVAPEDIAVAAQAEPRFERPYSGWYWQITGPDGALARSRSAWDFVLPVVAGPHGSGLHVGHGFGPRGEALVVVERDIEFADRAAPLHFSIAAARGEIDEEVARFRTLLAAAFAALALGLLAAIVLQVRYGLKPLRRMAGELERLRRGEIERLAADYPAEIKPLAAAMNGVLDHDAALIERARAHAGDLAHALKTPLAVIKADLAARGGDAAIDGQLAAMTRAVERHLARARAAVAGGPRPQAGCRPAEVVGQLAAMMEKLFAEKCLAVRSAVPPDPVVAVERDDLADMLGNLMENAARHARGLVALSARETDGALVIVVDDDGPGMTEAEAKAAVRRGVRLDEAEHGWGLGLAIVGDLAAAHDGDLRFGRSPLGGLRVELELPLRR